MTASGWTLPRALDAAARTRSGVHFVQEDGRESFESYEQLRSRASSIARHLADLGVGPGHRVALLIPEAEGFIPSLFGVSMTGAVAVPLAPPMNLAQLGAALESWRRMVRIADVRVILTTTRLRAVLGTLPATVPTVGAVISLGRPHRGPGRRPRRRATTPRGPRPVHVGIDVTPEGRGAGAREPGRQRRGHHGPGRHRRLGPRRGRQLAAALPRHGAHRGRDRQRQRRVAHRAPAPAAVPEAARRVAAGHHPPPRDHELRAELRVRPVRPARVAAGGRGPGPVVLARRRLRSRAHSIDHPRDVRGDIRARRLPPNELPALLRPGRARAGRHVPPVRRGVAHRPRARRRAPAGRRGRPQRPR